jgi:taurine dioxygenase
MKVEILSHHIGAEIHDFDLKSDLNAETAEQLRQLVLKHEVIFLKNQRTLSPTEYLGLISQIYRPMPHPFISEQDPLVPGISPYQPYSDLPEVTGIRHGAKNKGNLNEWHSDLNWLAQPSQASVLRAMVLPKIGGNTVWSSMSAAYEGLDENTKRRVDNLRVCHDFTQIYHGCFEGQAEVLAKMQSLYPSQTYPLALKHPLINKKSLFANRVSTTGIEGLDPSDSHELLDKIYGLAKIPEYQVRFRWSVNDIAIWDNLLTQHYAVSDYWPEVRQMERISIAGISVQ